MATDDDLDRAILTALDRTRHAQERVGEDLGQGIAAAGDASEVVRRADDLHELADEAAGRATGSDEASAGDEHRSG